MLFPALVWAQITITPTIVFMHDGDPAGRITITNSSDVPQEVNISLSFGYPDSDEAGNLLMNYEDEEAAARFGLDDVMRVFPRRFELAPGENQILRMQVQQAGMRAREDGLHWTRMNITSNERTRAVDEGGADRIGARISYRIQQNIGIFYRKGEVRTGLELLQLSDRRDAETGELHLIPRLQRTGNSPFMGTMFASLRDASGAVVRESERTFSVYFTQTRPITLDTTNLPPGRYTARLRLEPTRTDLNPRDQIPGEPLEIDLEVAW